MSKKEKFLTLVSNEETNTVAKAKDRIAKRAYSRMAKSIAIAILARLEALNWKQIDLAEKMEVSPQQISKWLKGDENLTLETIANLSKVLEYDLIAVNKTDLNSKEEIISSKKVFANNNVQELTFQLPCTLDYSSFKNNIAATNCAKDLVAMKCELKPINTDYQVT